MNPDHSTPSNPPGKLEVRSWYLIGLAFVLIALLILGECFAFQWPLSGEIRSSAGEQKPAGAGEHSQVSGSRSSAGFAGAEEL